MQASDRAIKLIKKWEGLYLKAYTDVAGVWTIGYGTTTRAGVGITVVPGMVITKEAAEDYLEREVDKIEPLITKALKVTPTQSEYDAFVVFVYNVGIGAFLGSTMLKLFNRGDKAGASRQFMRWVMALDKDLDEKVVVQGLVNRRKDEQKLFNETFDKPATINTDPVVADSVTQSNPSKVVVPKINENWFNEVWKSNIVRIAFAGIYAQALVIMDNMTAFSTNAVLAIALVSVVVLIGAVIWQRVKDARERA